MIFLIDACLPRAVAALLSSYEHRSEDVRDIGLARSDDRIAQYAKDKSLCLLTEDFDFSDVRVYPPADYAGIVVFDTEGMRREEKLSLVQSLLDRSDILPHLPGRLAIVKKNKIRLRPPP